MNAVPTNDSDLVATVDTFLQLFEARDIAAAEKLMTPHPLIVFPPGQSFESLHELVGGLKKNYSWVKKNRDHYSVGKDQQTGLTVVVSRGRLFGEDLDGKPFEGVPYIDYFVFDGALIAEQHVWNHLAAAGISGRGGG